MFRRRTARILVVEDDAELRSFYRLVLEQEGYSIDTAGDGYDALHYIEHQTPDLVLLDLGLPLVPGWDVKREIRARGLNVPVLVITGMDPQTLDPADFRSVLRKPVSAEALVHTVNIWLAAKGRDVMST